MSRPDCARTGYVTVLLPLVAAGVRLCCFRHAHSTAGLLELVLTDLITIMSTIIVGYVLAQALAWDAVP